MQNTHAAASVKFSDAQTCKAGISTLMGKSPSIMKITKKEKSVIYLSYKRPDDGTTWSYKCQISGNRIIWASIFKNGEGRWRTHPLDEVITYQTSGDKITVSQKYSDGSETIKNFRLKELGK